MDEREPRGTDALADLACAEGLITPVEGDAAARRWMDCDLASFAEHRCGEIVDPATLDDVRRADLSRRALAPDEDLAIRERRVRGSPRSGSADGTERLGTLAIARGSYWRFAPRSSLYVFPAARGRGIAYRRFADCRSSRSEPVSTASDSARTGRGRKACAGTCTGTECGRAASSDRSTSCGSICRGT